MKHVYIPLIAFIISFTLTSCKKKCCNDPTNPDCENYDPCYGIQEANAEFVIEENVNGRYFIGDTVGGVSLHRFRALHNADSFIWKLGSETIREKQFERRFFPNDKWLEVQLIVFKKANSNCNKKQKISDTLKKRFYSWDETIDNQYGIPIKPAPIYGDYKGFYESSSSNLINISLKDTLFKSSNGQIISFFYINGFPYPNTNNYKSKLLLNNHIYGVIADYIVNPTKLNCIIKCVPAFKSYAYLDRYNRNKIYIEFDFQDTLTNEWKHDKFIGYRN